MVHIDAVLRWPSCFVFTIEVKNYRMPPSLNADVKTLCLQSMAMPLYCWRKQDICNIVNTHTHTQLVFGCVLLSLAPQAKENIKKPMLSWFWIVWICYGKCWKQGMYRISGELIHSPPVRQMYMFPQRIKSWYREQHVNWFWWRGLWGKC